MVQQPLSTTRLAVVAAFVASAYAASLACNNSESKETAAYYHLTLHPTALFVNDLARFYHVVLRQAVEGPGGKGRLKAPNNKHQRSNKDQTAKQQIPNGEGSISFMSIPSCQATPSPGFAFGLPGAPGCQGPALRADLSLKGEQHPHPRQGPQGPAVNGHPPPSMGRGQKVVSVVRPCV